MGDDLSGILHRQDQFDDRVTRLEFTVKEQAGLRADMDKELGDISAKLNAHEKSLNALAKTQSEHTKTLADHTSRLTRIEDRLGNVETGLETVKVGVHAILDLLDANLAKKGLMSRLAGRFTRHRDAA